MSSRNGFQTQQADVILSMVTAPKRIPCGAKRKTLHMHDCYELTLVLRGSCIVEDRIKRALLVPGDLLLTDIAQPHACSIQADSAVYRCSFSRAAAPEVIYELLHEIPEEHHDMQQRVHDLYTLHTAENNSTAAEGTRLFRLKPEEVKQIRTLFASMEQEQKNSIAGFQQMTQIYLHQLLIQLARMQRHHFKCSKRGTTWKQDMVDAILQSTTHNLESGVDFEVIARKNGITLNYFRVIFKEIMGMTPIEYLNQLRVAKALELLQTSSLPISEVSAQVGILDANYFSRLFKKVTGYPPRYFKSIDI